MQILWMFVLIGYGFLLSLNVSCHEDLKAIVVKNIELDVPEDLVHDDVTARQLKKILLKEAVAVHAWRPFWLGRDILSYHVKLKMHEIAEQQYWTLQLSYIDGKEVTVNKPYYMAQLHRETQASWRDKQALELVLKHLWQTIDQQRRLSEEGSVAWIKALQDESISSDLQEFVLQRIAQDKVTEAVDILCKKLFTAKDSQQLSQWIGTLVALGDSKAVNALIELGWQRHHDMLIPLIFAISKLGGKTAQGFLVTLETGHPEPQIQQAARDALNGMP